MSSLFLKSIEIVGFKSFARTTRIELPSGITALVGPNGSGKSNVVDAIRWCLGEQSMRDLRGQRAEDVIYAGPRRTMGFAEVTLTLEAERGESAVPWASMSIGRHVQRSGESEYLVNGERVRLRDVMASLREIGVDASRHVVVTQGMADALLAATPTERRVLLEHAAGLSGYRVQREEARSKLSTTAQNMLTIETVLAEMEPRVRMLRRQARAVQDREEAASRLRLALIQWYAARWHEARHILTEAETTSAEIGKERDAVSHDLHELEAASELRLEAERAFQQRLETTRAAFHTTQRESDAARFRLQQALERQQSADAARSDGTARGAVLRKSLEHALARRASAESDAQAVSGEHARQQSALLDIERQIEDVRVSEREAEKCASAASECTERAQTRHAALNQEVTATRAAMAEHSTAEEKYVQQLQSVTTGLDTLSVGEAEIETHLQVALAASAEASATLLKAEEQLEKVRVRVARTERVRVRLRTHANRIARAREVAVRALSALGAYAESAPLSELNVPEGWEHAAAAALGQWRPAFDSDHPGWQPGDLDGFLHWRADLDVPEGARIWADAAFRAESLPTPNPLLATLLADDADRAHVLWTHLYSQQAHLIGSPPIQIVTRSGEVLSAMGTRLDLADDRGARYLVARRDATRYERLALRNARWNEGVAAMQALESAALERAEGRLREAAAMDTSTGAEVSKARDRQSALSHRRTQLQAELQSIEKGRTHSRTRHQELSGQHADLESEIEGSGAALREASDIWQARNDELLSVRISLAALSDQRDAIARTVRECESHVTELRRSQVAAEGEIARLQHEIEQLDSNQQQLTADLLRLENAVGKARGDVETLAGLLEEGRARVRAIEAQRPAAAPPTADLAATRTYMAGVLARHERALAQKEQRKVELETLEAEIWRELGIAPQSLTTDLAEVPTDDEIRRLRSRANQYADVDQSVIRESAEMDERYSGLRDHLEDLRTATDELQMIMAVADAEMNARFGGAFDAVNQEFARVFTVMLRGGEAHLELQNDDGGVGIWARLPGKRAGSSAAFSGGERSLVASSLLFGVLNIRPTPFCVLDEVDAALDESNVDRYLAALRDISAKTQIIVVTHNRATMAAADVLYGVTMDTEGVTGLLSLRLDQYEAAG